MYEHNVKFVPMGTSPRNATSIKTVTFVYDSLNKSDVKNKAYKRAKTDLGIDNYALRKHWEIFNTEVRYANKPWNSFDELCGQIISYDDVKSWKLIEESIIVLLKDKSSQKDFEKKLRSYYKGFKINHKNSNLLIIGTKPKYI